MPSITASCAPDPEYPYAHRVDLPAHERSISAKSLAQLRAGIAEAAAGFVTPFDVTRLANADDNE